MTEPSRPTEPDGGVPYYSDFPITSPGSPVESHALAGWECLCGCSLAPVCAICGLDHSPKVSDWRCLPRSPAGSVQVRPYEPLLPTPRNEELDARQEMTGKKWTER